MLLNIYRFKHFSIYLTFILRFIKYSFCIYLVFILKLFPQVVYFELYFKLFLFVHCIQFQFIVIHCSSFAIHFRLLISSFLFYFITRFNFYLIYCYLSIDSLHSFTEFILKYDKFVRFLFTCDKFIAISFIWINSTTSLISFFVHFMGNLYQFAFFIVSSILDGNSLKIHFIRFIKRYLF